MESGNPIKRVTVVFIDTNAPNLIIDGHLEQREKYILVTNKSITKVTQISFEHILYFTAEKINESS